MQNHSPANDRLRVRILRRLHWLLPLVFIMWVAVSVALLMVYGSQLPVMATNILSLVFVPFLPFIPLLRTQGLVSGYDAWVIPSPAGAVLCVSFYAAVLYFLGRLLQSRFGHLFRAK